MSRPEVRVENYEKVYEYYRNHQPLMATAKLGYFLMAQGMAPEVTYEEGAKDEISDHLEDGGQFIVVPNHLTDFDQYTVAGIASSEPLLHPLLGSTFVLAKSSLFVASKLQRLGIDTMGAIPVFRTKDHRDKPEKQAIRAEAAEMLADVCRYRVVERGNHGAIFGEGERNTEDPSVVQEFKHGISNLIIASPGVNIVPLPIGIRYPLEGGKFKRHPRVHIGRPVFDTPRYPAEYASFSQRLRVVVQECVDATARVA